MTIFLSYYDQYAVYNKNGQFIAAYERKCNATRKAKKIGGKVRVIK